MSQAAIHIGGKGEEGRKKKKKKNFTRREKMFLLSVVLMQPTRTAYTSTKLLLFLQVVQLAQLNIAAPLVTKEFLWNGHPLSIQ